MVSDTDEIELAKQLEKLEEANREISGDEDSQGSSEDESDEGEEAVEPSPGIEVA